MFEITILQEELSDILNRLEPTVGKNNQGLNDDCISMEASDIGSCIFYTTNGSEFTTITGVCSNATKAFKAPLVNFKRLKSIINSIDKTNYVTIKSNGSQLLISYSISRKPIIIEGISVPMIPLPSSNTTNEMHVSMDYFTDAINKASTLVKKSEITYITDCIKFSNTGSDITAEAIDVNTKRTFYMKGKTVLQSATVNEITLEADKVKKSLKLFKDYDDIEIKYNNGIIIISGGTLKSNITTNSMINVKYYTSHINGVFPNVAQLYESQYDPLEKLQIPQNQLLQILERVSALEEINSVTPSRTMMNANGNELEITFQSSHGSLSESIVLTNNVQSPFTVSIAHKQLESILKSLTSEDINIGEMEGSKGVFRIENCYPLGTSTSKSDYCFTLSAMNQQVSP